MKIVDPGHAYDLHWLDGKPFVVPLENCDPPNRLTFVKREGPGYPGNVGHYPGTTMQEVLRALIDRVKYVEGQIPHPDNFKIITLLQGSIFLLESRAAERHGRPFTAPIQLDIENVPTCTKCGHILCPGTCHS
jgi:hypothetical protein